MMKKNDIKALLRQGRAVIGSWITLPSPSLVNVAAAAGLDFVIIDMEHGPHSFETAEDMVRAAQTENCSPLVRVSKKDEALILNALDIGSSGVVVPHIESKEDAELAISHAKYYPLGKRGFSPFTRAGKYSLNSVKTHSETQNKQTVIVLMIEGKDGIDNLGDILTIKDITKKADVIYIGAYDLSQALGIPGEVDHPDVRKALKECVKAIRAKGLAAGGYVAKNKNDIAWMRDMGMQFITLLPDCAVLYHAFEALRDDFNSMTKKAGNKRI